MYNGITMANPKILVQVMLDEALRRDIDRRARQLGITRSEFIRRACMERLNGSSEAARDLAYLEGLLDRRDVTAAADASLRMAAERSDWTW